MIGNMQPTWRGDGRELYFLAPDGTFMAADIRPGAEFAWSDPCPLFRTTLAVEDDTEQYAPHPDGTRFLIAKPSGQNSLSPFNVVLNWTSLLKK